MVNIVCISLSDIQVWLIWLYKVVIMCCSIEFFNKLYCCLHVLSLNSCSFVFYWFQILWSMTGVNLLIHWCYRKRIFIRSGCTGSVQDESYGRISVCLTFVLWHCCVAVEPEKNTTPAIQQLSLGFVKLFLQTGCISCSPSKSVKARKRTLPALMIYM